eukprot:CAMPEP_0184679858 /NCGR_PEP_ID=MMETSP0312-20130426/2738_1 /TAXON_ID=31354 /ORGANISM="Compsopogon coeruleus, Strain SAG 36.94" /LENGTH=73 /DNA_ID=CAMNT_0027129595 /DNA_START=189 /DNA_END=407 /DNA_ORIENTATION=+
MAGNVMGAMQYQGKKELAQYAKCLNHDDHEYDEERIGDRSNRYIGIAEKRRKAVAVVLTPRHEQEIVSIRRMG